jgi:hypothetical protein
MWRLGWLILLAVLAAGCGKPGPSYPSARWEGTVTLQGKPIPAEAEAYVQFFPNGGGGQAPPASVPIMQGRYRAERVPLGKVTVVFNITRLTGRMVREDNAPGATPYAEREILVPPSLRAGIPAEVTGDQQRDFNLQ